MTEARQYSHLGLNLLFQDVGENIAKFECSGESVWMPERDPENGLLSFLDETLFKTDPDAKVDVHLESLMSMNSSTMKVLARSVGKQLKKGCHLKINYDPGLASHRFFIDMISGGTRGELGDRIEFIPKEGKHSDEA